MRDGKRPRFRVLRLDDQEKAFLHANAVVGRYHGYPVRRSNPYFDEIVDAWNGA